ncbi:cation:proton antiporter [Halomicroarcula limicola]|uniref:Cation:proton antiporter n=1 Tax=Haloarcula limicola TaxID=1429915 RepID=A0A8J7YAU4_9EURY|nr:cation:proton antiporter [Halomicroarcula limicola]MBV0925068.1 cation:proton antiporter [Halomicroarcula limicola]
MVGEPGPLLHFLASLTLILAVAHALGALSDRVGFAPVVGELLTGLVLGPSVLGAVAPAAVAALLPLDDGVAGLASLGLVLLVVLAGTEVDPARIRGSLGPTVAVASGATVVPFLGGVALGFALPTAYLPAPPRRLGLALFLGTALSISALPVAARVLVDLDVIDRAVGQLTLTVAVVVDAVGWITLTVVAEVVRGGGVDPIAVLEIVALLAAFALVVLVAGRPVVDGLRALAARARSPVLSEFAVVLVVGFAVTAAAVGLGLEAVVGAFLAGLLVGPRVDAETERVLHLATLGLFAPLFFATAGLQVDLTVLADPAAAAIAVAALVVAILGKVVGVALGAAPTELTRAETACLAIGLNARGAMEIVVAAAGLALGVLTPLLYAVVVLVAIATSVMTPPLLRRAVERLPPESAY